MAKSLGEEQVEISDLGQSTQGARGRVRNNTLTLRFPNQSSTPRTDQQFLKSGLPSDSHIFSISLHISLDEALSAFSASVIFSATQGLSLLSCPPSFFINGHSVEVSVPSSLPSLCFLTQLYLGE